MADVRELAHKYLRMKDHAAKVREKTEEAIGKTVEAAEVTGSAFAFGFLNGYSPAQGLDHHELAKGVPTDLAVGFVLHLLGFFGAAGKHSDHAHALANGGLASWGVRAGQKMGNDRRARAAAGSPPATRGAFAPQRPAWGAGFAPQYARVDGVG